MPWANDGAVKATVIRIMNMKEAVKASSERRADMPRMPVVTAPRSDLGLWYRGRRSLRSESNGNQDHEHEGSGESQQRTASRYAAHAGGYRAKKRSWIVVQGAAQLEIGKQR